MTPLDVCLLLAALGGVALAVVAVLRWRKAEIGAQALKEKLRAHDEHKQRLYRDIAFLNDRIHGLIREEAAARKFAQDSAIALDACARLLDGQRGHQEWATARTALRATGRLGAAHACKVCNIGKVLTDSKGVATCAMCGESGK